ncbi:LysR family transcriptional regulator [Vibrio sp. S17_S38]|uniref:LysR family transcriptional regulator n=1 Tax=Vibrio sp. S17_S38 TaxID=2720229 RepID=UPI001680C3FA|nr:LysR family transcriptional regulator [Vibrio sp. S17_S38]MBD1573377.1 LysR family transcriptional regulator [Vibrio sp. S17_S38]
MKNQIKNLIIFLEVYSAGSYRKAGQNLSVSITSISRALADLELDLNCQLFINISGEFKPTSKAKGLFEAIRVSTNQISHDYNMFRSMTNHISILLPPQLSSNGLIKLVNEFNVQHNQELSLFEHSYFESRERALDALISGELDVMIDFEKPSSFRYESCLLCEFDLFLIASKNNPIDLNNENNYSEFKFAKSCWLGQRGELLEQTLGIKQEEQTGILVQNLTTYYSIIKDSSLVGLAPIIAGKTSFSDYKISHKAIGTIKLYFICTKAAFESRPIVSWLKHNFEDTDFTLFLSSP